MQKKYGWDMVYLNVLGQGILILGSWERTYDLFEKRSSNYSDRIHSPLILDIMEWGYNMALVPYGIWWRRHRRAFHDFFHPNIVNIHQPTQLNTARKFIQHLLESPQDFDRWISHAAASNIMEVAYGIRPGLEDPYVHNAEEALVGISDAGTPGRYLVETFPIMKYIPAWFPGAGWRRKANYYRDVNRDVCFRPWNLVKDQMKTGEASPSVARTLIDKLPDPNAPERAEEETIAIHTCAVSFIGGSETTISAVRTFFMAMCLYPEVQKKAHAQLDSVLKGRLPEFNDRPSLPYISAIVKETMRWQLVLPLAVYHMATEDDEYDGYFIPKGTLVAGNAWSILHDPEIYEDPDHFNPDRYLKDGQLNPAVRNPLPAFGFGRRICPGRFFSDNVMFATIAHTLAVFDIKPALDEAGKEIKIEADTTGGLVTQPLTFRCRIVPRSSAAIKLIQNAEMVDY
ncbi:O-methylsterigmatocystin oxidoreductase [Leucoagaricus sp. SymC.cos]|nr:O-methylsterigmatocystin oxidoreductase [Leucoagaricus sp. SymC.cos]